MAVLEAVVQGRTLEEAGVDSAFLLEVAKHPTLGLGFAKAREMSSYALEEEALGRLRAAVVEGKLTAPQLRAIDLLVQQLRWSAIKRNPNVYSEKAAVNITVPIEIKTSLDLGGSAASGGTKEFPNIYEAVAEVPSTVPIEQAAKHFPRGNAAEDIQYGSAPAEAETDYPPGNTRQQEEEPARLRPVRDVAEAAHVRAGTEEATAEEPGGVVGQAKERPRAPARQVAKVERHPPDQAAAPKGGR